jgi:hypothetical protein
MSDTNFTMFFLPKMLANRCGPPVIRGPQFEEHCSKKTAVICTTNTKFYLRKPQEKGISGFQCGEYER